MSPHAYQRTYKSIYTHMPDSGLTLAETAFSGGTDNRVHSQIFWPLGDQNKVGQELRKKNNEK